MTDREAAEILRTRGMGWDAALAHAIAALERPEPAGDLVSREAVLELVEHVFALPTLGEKHCWVDCLPGKLRSIPRYPKPAPAEGLLRWLLDEADLGYAGDRQELERRARALIGRQL
jgi:hypothetical protein